MNEEVRVLDMTHANEVIREVNGGIAPTMQSRMGTGGNQAPLVMGVFNQHGSKGTGHAATQDQSLVLRHIVRRLTPTECSRLQGFPDQWCRIPMGKWRKIDDAEADYLRSQGAWVEPHIRPRKDGGTETDLAPDSPMYRCLGNSWATNCAEWILRRVVAAIRLGLIQ